MLWLFIGRSTPSVNIRITRRPSWCWSAVIATLTAFQSGVGPGSCNSVLRISISSLVLLVKSRGSSWMRFAKLPMRALSAGSSWPTNCSAADRTSVKLLIMLPLRSSISTIVIG